MIAPQDNKEPKTFSNALSGPKPREWIKAIKEKIESVKTNQV
jgi:hypothetical protein